MPRTLTTAFFCQPMEANLRAFGMPDFTKKFWTQVNKIASYANCLVELELGKIRKAQGTPKGSLYAVQPWSIARAGLVESCRSE